MSLQDKNILIGVTGGISAYKSADLVRLLRENKADVQVVMTEAAKQFITPLTLQALSGHPVRDDLFSLAVENAMGHIELARWADMIVIVPATADIIAQLAYGFAETLLTTLCLATTAPIAVVPAMNQQMWHNSVTQSNIKLLKQHHFQIWGPAHGDQACGDVGLGRMLEPDEIITHIKQYYENNQKLNKKKILITAGPTREALDPVRCITNFSSGKMGYALANAARNLGAEVILISGPTQINPPAGVQFKTVESAAEMHTEVMLNLTNVDIFIGTAAVADYRPEKYVSQKIKKSQDHLNIQLVPNPDIIAEVAAHKNRPKMVVGFAAESQDLIENAKQKLQRKKLDMVIANEVGAGKGFEMDDNKVFIVTENKVDELPLLPKAELAYKILNYLVQKINL